MKHNDHARKLTIGIIGDGQLGMYLAEAAPALGLSTVLLTGDRRSPAAQRADDCIEAPMDDVPAIRELARRCDVITYEREDVPPAAIAALRSAESAGATQCFPSLDIIELLQDKARQKRWLADKGLETLPFHIVDGSADQLQRGAGDLGYPLVQKALRGGFDGRGVQILRDEGDLAKAWPGETLLEQYAGDFREVAVLLVRARDGALAHFGPVDMSFESAYSVLDTVSAPSRLDATLADKAVDLATRTITAMQGVGVFGVEMFVLADGRVLINEIAPRVHNSGHYTMDACASSQFEQHLRAVTGLPLAPVDLKHPAAMRNVLCTDALLAEGVTHEAGTETLGNTATYWYGKSPARAMRKLGHITAVSRESADSALASVNARWQDIQDQAHEAARSGEQL